jgi:hypothetical protein
MSERNTERAAFLRSRRQRLTPEEVGLPRSGRRRIPTLRREDVAWLADVGITWYTWLEQGRPIKIASGTLDRIASALRLDDSESEYLRKVAQPNANKRPHWDAPVTEHIRALVESYEPGYAFVMGPRWDVLACNDAFAGLLELNGASAGDLERNGLWIMFTHQRMRSVFPAWEEIARRMVATFRVEYADYVGDGAFGVLIDALTTRSPEFVAMWADVDVLSPTRWTLGEIRDPDSGSVVALDTVSLSVPDSPGQTVVFNVPTRCEIAAAS